jgi:hypothetical protein
VNPLWDFITAVAAVCLSAICPPPPTTNPPKIKTLVPAYCKKHCINASYLLVMLANLKVSYVLCICNSYIDITDRKNTTSWKKHYLVSSITIH